PSLGRGERRSNPGGWADSRMSRNVAWPLPALTHRTFLPGSKSPGSFRDRPPSPTRACLMECVSQMVAGRGVPTASTGRVPVPDPIRDDGRADLLALWGRTG